MESLQKVEVQAVICNSFRSSISNLTEKTAAVSSSLGMLTVFTGTSLDFAITNEHCILS